MHLQYCPKHKKHHIPCNCCGDGWFSADNKPSPCGAYKNRDEYIEEARKHDTTFDVLDDYAEV